MKVLYFVFKEKNYRSLSSRCDFRNVFSQSFTEQLSTALWQQENFLRSSAKSVRYKCLQDGLNFGLLYHSGFSAGLSIQPENLPMAEAHVDKLRDFEKTAFLDLRSRIFSLCLT